MNDYLAWFDGACEPVNPGGTASLGVVIKGEDGTVLLKDHGVVGKGKAMSNNVAEYAGVLRILKYLSSRPPGRVTIHGDSNLVISQLSGKWCVRKGLYLSTALETKELLAYLRGLGWQINFCWIPREQNEECDALSKKSGHVTAEVSESQVGNLNFKSSRISTEIMTLVAKHHGVSLDRESIVSALAKRIARKDRFARTGPSTFSIRPDAER